MAHIGRQYPWCRPASTIIPTPDFRFYPPTEYSFSLSGFWTGLAAADANLNGRGIVFEGWVPGQSVMKWSGSIGDYLAVPIELLVVIQRTGVLGVADWFFTLSYNSALIGLSYSTQIAFQNWSLNSWTIPTSAGPWWTPGVAAGLLRPNGDFNIDPVMWSAAPPPPSSSPF